MPPLPDSKMSGTSPLGAGRAVSFTSARRAAVAAISRDVDRVEQLEADGEGAGLVPGLHAGVADGDARHAEARAHLVVADEEPVTVGDLDSAATVPVGGRHLGDGVPAGARRLVGLDEELDLAGLGDLFGELGHLVPLHRTHGARAPTTRPPPPWRATAAAASAAARRPLSERSAVWA